MKFDVIDSSVSASKADVVVVGIVKNNDIFQVVCEDLTDVQITSIQEFLKIGDVSQAIGSSRVAYGLAGFKTRVLILGLGNGPEKLCSGDVKVIYKTIISALKETKAEVVEINITTKLAKGERAAYRTARLAVEAINYERYEFKRFLTRDKKADGKHAENCGCCTGIKNVYFVSQDASFAEGLKDGVAVSKGIKLARDLGNLPASICTPAHFGEVGKELANSYEKVTSTSLGYDELKALGMGLYTAVSQGSKQEHRAVLTLVEYKGGPAEQAPIVLVGKGLSFDSGGLSIKPALGMAEMKFDMCGAASVLGTLKAIAELNLPINVVAAAAGCENLIDAESYRPGDILKSLNGLTVEIDNTDAEGRLVLADTLTYIGKYKPKYVIDVATLTGACVIALGEVYTAILGNDEDLQDNLFKAGKFVQDKAWPLPIAKEHKTDMKGKVADLVNSSGSKAAGTSKAGAFLSEFTKDYKWAHLDIAGTGWISAGKNSLATGRPVSLLVEFLKQESLK